MTAKTDYNYNRAHLKTQVLRCGLLAVPNIDMSMYKYLFTILILAGIVPALPGQEIENIPLYLNVSDLESAKKPYFFEDNIIFSYVPDRRERVRFVGTAFEFENFTRIHPFKRNANGVYFLVLPIPDGRDALRYRYQVDGIWIDDPQNPGTRDGTSGISISRLQLPERIERAEESPLIKPAGMVSFYYYGSPDRRVSVAGSFNNWDPYFHSLEETKRGSGVYKITLRLLPGRYYYYFIIDGERRTDPLNSETVYNFDSKAVSAFTQPY